MNDKRTRPGTDRPLCEADHNTCPNLAGYKEKRDGVKRYHRFCDKHRRLGHDAKAFRNPRSKRYLPLDRCALCTDKAEHRHRVDKDKGYIPSNVVRVCHPCHKKVHTYLNIVLKLQELPHI